MYQLGIFDQFQFPSRGSATYVLDITRTDNGIATISSDQRLSLFDPTRISAGPVASLVTDHGNLALLKILDGGLACTAGENGTVSVWDFRQPSKIGSVTQFKGMFEYRCQSHYCSILTCLAASQAPIMSMACNAGTQTIAVGTELQSHTASIFLWYVNRRVYHSKTC